MSQGAFFDSTSPCNSVEDDAADRADLATRLPGLRHGGCPDGSVDAIVAMSSPRAHTACPNPYISEWLESLPERKDLERDDPGPFTEDVSGKKTSLAYKAHSYPTKVPPEIIARQILHYTRPGDVVLDGFAGSGMTGVAAQMCSSPDSTFRDDMCREAKQDGRTIHWGKRRTILNDLAPGATFIAAGLNLPVDADAFDRASTRLLERFDAEYGWMYQTTVNGRQERIDYTIWSEVFTCPHCGGEVVFYDAAFDAATGAVAKSFDCQRCGATVTKRALLRRKERVRTLAGDVIERITFRPVRIAWSRGTGRHKVKGEKELDATDLAVLQRVSQLQVDGFPSTTLPLGTMVHGSRLGPKGFKAVHHLYSDRALAALSVLWTWAAEDPRPDVRRSLRFWIEQAFWGLSWMNRFVPTHFSHVNQFLNGVFYVSSLAAECSPRYNLVGSRPSTGKRANLVKLWRSQNTSVDDVRVSTGSATELPIPSDSVDYIFVDPPFGENIPYADLAIVLESWHGVTTHVSDEAVVDKFKAKPLEVYADVMTSCFREFHRVLKPGRWMTVEFSNHSNEVWAAIQQGLAAAGFVVADTRVLDKEQGSYRQVTASNSVKRDLIISCYKPSSRVTETLIAAGGNVDGVWSFVREHLRHLPVTDGRRGKARLVRERHADRIYDRMIAFHVANGLPIPLTARQFFTGMDAQFVMRDDMYFLPDQAEQYERFRITFRELEDQQLFVTDENSAIEWLRQLLRRSRRPMTFAEIQPLYMKELQQAAETWKEVPDIRVLLEDNFVRADGGDAWVIPDPRKADHLEQLRQADLLRVFADYLDGRGTLTRFRGEAVLAGFKQAWSDGDYQRIVAVGARIPPDALIEIPAALHYIRNARKRIEA